MRVHASVILSLAPRTRNACSPAAKGKPQSMQYTTRVTHRYRHMCRMRVRQRRLPLPLAHARFSSRALGLLRCYIRTWHAAGEASTTAV